MKKGRNKKALVIAMGFVFSFPFLWSCGLVWQNIGKKKEIESYFADPRDTSGIRRVLVLPFFIEDNGDADPMLVWQIFCKELHKTSRFEVIPLPENDHEEWMDNIARLKGIFPISKLLDFCEKYGTDAVVFGTVTRFRAYRPPCLGLRVGMVSAQTGQVVWEADVIFDMADQESLLDLKHYLNNVASPGNTLDSWEMTLLSPRRFASYVCHRVVERWKTIDSAYR